MDPSHKLGQDLKPHHMVPQGVAKPQANIEGESEVTGGDVIYEVIDSAQ